jgi:hypothetical protein
MPSIAYKSQTIEQISHHTKKKTRKTDIMIQRLRSLQNTRIREVHPMLMLVIAAHEACEACENLYQVYNIAWAMMVVDTPRSVWRTLGRSEWGVDSSRSSKVEWRGPTYLCDSTLIYKSVYRFTSMWLGFVLSFNSNINVPTATMFSYSINLRVADGLRLLITVSKGEAGQRKRLNYHNVLPSHRSNFPLRNVISKSIDPCRLVHGGRPVLTCYSTNNLQIYTFTRLKYCGSPLPVDDSENSFHHFGKSL